MINGSWNGFRELVLTDKAEVCPGIISFYFTIYSIKLQLSEGIIEKNFQ